MFIPGNANQYFSRKLAERSHPESDLRTGEAEKANETAPELHWDQFTINYTQESRYFKGFLLALPVSMLMWVGIILGIRAIFF